MDLKIKAAEFSDITKVNEDLQDRSVRVMHVILNLDIGGAQEVVRTLVRQMAIQGHHPVVCTFKDGPIRKEIEEAGIPVEILPDRRYSFLALPQFIMEWIRIRNALLELIEKHHIEIVQTHLLQSLDFLVATISMSSPRPSIFWTIHNERFILKPGDLPRYPWLLGIKRYFYRLLFSRTIRLISGVIVVSEEVKNALVKNFDKSERKITVINNCVEVEKYQKENGKSSFRKSLGFDDGSSLVLTVATLKQQKGHRYLIEAAAEIISEFPKTHFLFVGDGQLRDELTAQVMTLGIEKHIEFLGNREDVPSLLACGDFFVLPSLWEGLPMALIEAMASGLPIVATDVSGSRQVMVDGETGLLVPPGNSRELASALRTLICNPEISKEMGISAQKRVKVSFSAEKQSDEHIDLYLESLES